MKREKCYYLAALNIVEGKIKIIDKGSLDYLLEKRKILQKKLSLVQDFCFITFKILGNNTTDWEKVKILPY